MSQLPLELRLAAHARLDTFIARENAAVVEHLRALDRGAVWLWGAAGVGKSHLLQAMCRAWHARGQRSMYVPLGQAKAAAPGAELLTGLEALDFVALDDVQAVAGQPEWELALFRLFEALSSRDFALLLAARSGPLACGFNLPDLASRAAAAVVYRIAPLDDEGRLVALQSRPRIAGSSSTKPRRAIC